MPTITSIAPTITPNHNVLSLKCSLISHNNSKNAIYINIPRVIDINTPRTLSLIVTLNKLINAIPTILDNTKDDNNINFSFLFFTRDDTCIPSGILWNDTCNIILS